MADSSPSNKRARAESSAAQTPSGSKKAKMPASSPTSSPTSTSTPTSTVEFPQFSRLPLEMRRLIWAAALPEEDPPAVCVYSHKWVLSFMYPEDDENKAHIQVRIPTLSRVNREARTAMMDWARARGYTFRTREQTEGRVLVRRWTSQDPLFVSRFKWDEDFTKLPVAMWEGSDAVGGPEHPRVEAMLASVEHLALPAVTMCRGLEKLIRMIRLLPNIKTLWALWDRVPDQHYTERPVFGGKEFELNQGQPRWELERLDKTEPGKTVQMSMMSNTDEQLDFKTVELGPHMDDIDQTLALEELPETLWDPETGEVNVVAGQAKLKFV